LKNSDQSGKKEVSSISFDIIGPMGLLSKVKSIKKAQLISTKNEKVTDITNKVKLNGDSKIDVDLKGMDSADLSLNTNLITFEVEGSSGSNIFVNKTFDFKMKLSDEVTVKISQNNKKLLP
jgi:hypothetical protein